MINDREIQDEIIVEEGVSKQGLHRIHVIQLGSPVDVERWIIEKVLPMDGMVETFYRYEEEDTGVHHLRLYWRDAKCRDAKCCGDAKYCVSTEGSEVEDGR